jgi:hypothetical protein
LYFGIWALFGIWILPLEPFSVLDAVNVYSALANVELGICFAFRYLRGFRIFSSLSACVLFTIM